MASASTGCSPLTDPTPDSADGLWRGAMSFFVRRRVRITGIVFLLLLAEDAFEGVVPHDLTNFRDVRMLFGLGLVIAGVSVRSWAAGILHKRTELTTDGPYALVRHPLYIGSFLMMVGFCTLVDDKENIYFVLGPFVVLYFLHILNEERRLANRFGEQWQKYAGLVPRFIPRRLPTNGFAAWRLDQWKANREYQALAATFLGLTAIEIWRFL